LWQFLQIDSAMNTSSSLRNFSWKASICVLLALRRLPDET
jgi:hypothetical protein